MAFENSHRTDTIAPTETDKKGKPVAGNTPQTDKESRVKNAKTAVKNAGQAKETKKPKQTIKKDAPKSATKTPVKKAAVTPKATKAKPTVKKSSVKVAKAGVQKLIFQIRYHTHYGQDLFIMGDHPLLGNNQPEKAIPMQYFNEEYWYLVIDVSKEALINRDITYHYVLRNTDGHYSFDWGNDKKINLSKSKAKELLLLDAWNFAGYFENAFYTEALY